MIDVKSMNVQELEALCGKLRDKILQTVSANGGHLSSNIGAVELIVAMHYVFDAAKDPFIFDVSHQSYAHKLLTDRWEEFGSLRQFGGISGYTKPSESKFSTTLPAPPSRLVSFFIFTTCTGASGEIRSQLPQM